MAGTVTPLVVLPSTAFVRAPFVLTLEGQYIVKNMVLVAAGILVASTLRCGTLDLTRFRAGDCPDSANSLQGSPADSELLSEPIKEGSPS